MFASELHSFVAACQVFAGAVRLEPLHRTWLLLDELVNRLPAACTPAEFRLVHSITTEFAQAGLPAERRQPPPEPRRTDIATLKHWLARELLKIAVAASPQPAALPSSRVPSSEERGAD